MAATDLELSVLVSSYQRPDNLERVLQSLAVQQGVAGRFEVVVTDDGSTDRTPDLVAELAKTTPYSLRFVTHQHAGFQLARCRNEGAAAARAGYFLFLDGDCIVPPDHLLQHLRHRHANTAMAGYCYWLDRATTEQITGEVIRSGQYVDWTKRSSTRQVRMFDWKARFYSTVGHPTKPKLYGGNVGIWRHDFERVNGYDERFVGWGCEDDDFRLRLRRSQITVKSIVRWTHTYHLWHPPAPSAPQKWSEGRNVEYYHRSIRFRRCWQGLQQLTPDQLRIHVVGHAQDPDKAAWLLTRLPHLARPEITPDFEILFSPGDGRFSGRADCNVLVILDDTNRPEPAANEADIIVANRHCPSQRAVMQLPLHEIDRVLCDVA